MNKLYSAALNPTDHRIFGQGDSIKEVAQKTRQTRSFKSLSEQNEAFGIYTSHSEELVAIVLHDNRIIEVPQDDPQLDPTREEAQLLEEFDSNFIALLKQYSGQGVRESVLALTASGDIQDWLEMTELESA